MDRITGEGGEGVMLRKPDSVYEHKRSNKLLKVKKFEDAEATIIGHEKGTGRLTGLLGALRVKEDDGTEFKIGSGFND
jgi:DNA ligase-1